MNVQEFYEKNVTTVYYSNGFSILFSACKNIFLDYILMSSSSCLQHHVCVAGMKQVREHAG